MSGDGKRVRGGVAGPWNPSAWIRGHPYSAAICIGSVIMGVMTLHKSVTEFEWAYVLTARHLVNGEGIYGLSSPPFRSYTYPPFMAALFIPIAFLPQIVARVVWYLVTALCVVVIWRGSWGLSGGGRLEGAYPGLIDRNEHLVAVLGLACAMPYVQSGVAHQQTDPLITSLLIAGCLALEGSRAMRAATYFGLAAGMKCTPLLWAPYLAWLGRWRAAAWLVAVAVGVNLIPDLIRAPDGGGFWLARWFEQFLRPMGRADYLPGRWYAWILDNQSLAGTLTRWGTTCPDWQAGGLAIADRVHPLGPGTLRPLIYGLEGVLLLVAGFALRRRPAPAQPAGGPGAPRGALEYSVVLLLMVLFSPMSSRPHFATTLLPALCLARSAVAEDRRTARVLLLASIATTVAALPFWGRDAGRLVMWCGLLTWGALWLLAGCLWALVSDGRHDRRSAIVSRPRSAALRAPHGSGMTARRADSAARSGGRGDRCEGSRP